MPRSVLLIVDLEGVAGVDAVEDLAAFAPGFARARALLTDEVAAAVRGFRAAGYRHVRVSDSHRGGARGPNVLADQLPDVEIRVERDPYAPELFAGMDAVACLGMHAGAGAEGFAAHTVEVTSSWRCAGRLLSETDLVLGLAALRGVPALFVAGDDVLARATDAVPFAVTKQTLSRARARSRAPADVHADIERLAQAAPLALPAPPDGPIALATKSRWQREVLCRAAGVAATEREVIVDGGDFGERYRRCAELVRAPAPFLARALRSAATATLVEDACGLLLRGFGRGRPAPRADAGARAVASFLAQTAGDRSWQRADRALTLHMLAGHAPRLFAGRGLDAALDDAVRALAAVPASFPSDITLPEAMARLDALYLRSLRGAAVPIDAAGLRAYIVARMSESPMYAWLLAELGARLGVERPVRFPPRAFRARERVLDLYWLTHLFLLDTDYLARPLPRPGWETETEELLLAAPALAAMQRIDLAAEVAFCLQLAGEHEAPEHHDLLELIEHAQAPDGAIIDPSLATGRSRPAGEDQRLRAHATAACAVAFAGTMT